MMLIGSVKKTQIKMIIALIHTESIHELKTIETITKHIGNATL
jgi:hypothetical protein